MTFDQLGEYFARLPETIMDDVPDIVAETAIEYYKGTFDKKAFDGNPWKEALKPRTNGSLMVDSGSLVNSITVSLVSRQKVVISAGNDKVPYAKAHNEGFTGPVNVSQFTDKNGKNVKAHTRAMDLPQRQFLGKSDELALLLYERLEAYLKTIL